MSSFLKMSLGTVVQVILLPALPSHLLPISLLTSRLYVGTIIPIAAGRMRNAWFPFGIATYVTEAQLRSNSSLVVSERDFNFSGEIPRLQVSPSPVSFKTDPDYIAPVAPAKLVLLTPERATRLLSTIIPARLEFYRTPIPSNPTPVGRPSQAADPHKDVDELSPTTIPCLPPDAVAIFGSVSTADVAGAIRVWLSVSEEASRIVLAAEDVRFVRKYDDSLASGAQIETENAGSWEGSKVKELGEFEIEICVKGASEAVNRTVAVLPQDA